MHFPREKPLSELQKTLEMVYFVELVPEISDGLLRKSLRGRKQNK